MKSYLKFIVPAAVAVCAVAVWAFTAAPYSDFEEKKNLDIYVTLYKELNTYYVDTLNPTKLMKSGVYEMLESLDPYTDFIAEEDMEEYRTQTTGRYGGIGAVIGTEQDWVIVSEPYEGFPAQKAGLRAGDRLIEVDGKSAKNYRTDQVSAMLKGKPGTQVKVKISRPTASGTPEEFYVTMTREEIKIKNVPYYGMVGDGIGYIRLTGFMDRAGAEVHNALQALESKGKLKGLVFDLRGNPGGLLPEAINVVNVFTDKHTEIVSTKGRIEDMNKPYYTLNDAVDTKLPMVVLADGGSASAAEIVSGSLQDLDRAVIVGQKTFGKGLVQSTHNLIYGAKLKITTAKYYIPSGRCIQAINYAERNEDGSVKRVADSLKTAFKTRNGRKVWDGGGIDPDIALEPEKLANISISLITKNLIFQYANDYRMRHESIAEAKTFALTDAEYQAFVDWVSKKEYDYTTKSEKLYEELKKAADKEGYTASLQDDLDALKKTMMHDKQNDLLKEKVQLKSLLEEEIAARYYLGTGRIESALRSDKELKRAIEVLNDPKKVDEILAKK
ncbi:MAG: S41 family peptidase [Chitinophagales bacterium]